MGREKSRSKTNSAVSRTVLMPQSGGRSGLSADYHLTQEVHTTLIRMAPVETLDILAGAALLDRISKLSDSTARRLLQALEEGRVSLLPWYSVPHLLLGSAEVAIRNYTIGMRLLPAKSTPLLNPQEGEAGWWDLSSDAGRHTTSDRGTAISGDGLAAGIISQQLKGSAYGSPQAAHHRAAVNSAISSAVQGLGTMLTGSLELLLTLNGIAGQDSELQQAAIERLWRQLLLSAESSLDSPGTRLNQMEAEASLQSAEQLTTALASELMLSLAQGIRLKAPRGSQTLLALNPSPYPRRELIEIALPELPESIEVLDESGNSIVTDLLPEIDSTATLRVLADLPPCGYRSFALRTRRGPAPEAEIGVADSIENDFLQVSLDRQEGTLLITDRLRGTSYPTMNQIVDGGDLGDDWHYLPPANDVQIAFPTNAPLESHRYISQAEQALNYLLIYRLPVGIDATTQMRQTLTAQFAPMAIEVTVRLLPGLPRLDVQLRVRAQSQGHRMWVRFPFAESLQCWVDQPSGFRHLDVGDDTTPVTLLAEAFTTVCGGEAGFTLSSSGSRSIQYFGERLGGGLALTLLRAPMGLAVDAAVTQEELHFDYSLSFHGPDPAEGWIAGRSQVGRVLSQIVPRGRERLPTQLALVESEQADFVICSVRPAEDSSRAMVVRGYLAGQKAKEVSLRFGLPLQRVHAISVHGSPVEKAVRVESDQRVLAHLEPGELLTLWLEPA